MKQATNDNSFFGTESIWKILMRIAPPVMLAQLIQALYNIVDSYFVGRYSGNGLTALSVIFPVQLIITALAVGTGVGVNIHMARLTAQGHKKMADKTAGMGAILVILTWGIFALVSVFCLKPYVATSTQSAEAAGYANIYGTIVCVGSLGIFLESIWSKVHQAEGDMRLPMIAQVAGAITNIILDPILIFGWGFIPEMGIGGAAIATVIGQVVAAIITGVKGIRRPPQMAEMAPITKQIYLAAYPSIFMQILYTVYIVVLNVILAGFSDEAVTVLGLYYKMQTFFFIPLLGLQTCIVPVLSYNHARGSYDRCKRVMRDSVLFAMSFMLLGIFCFEFMPDQLIGMFSKSEKVLEIGRVAFRIIGWSFLPAVISLISPVFFQAIGATGESILLALTRQVFCLIPIFWGFSLIGLNYTWLAFPMAEILTSGIGIFLYLRQLRIWKNEEGIDKKIRQEYN